MDYRDWGPKDRAPRERYPTDAWNEDPEPPTDSITELLHDDGLQPGGPYAPSPESYSTPSRRRGASYDDADRYTPAWALEPEAAPAPRGGRHRGDPSGAESGRSYQSGGTGYPSRWDSTGSTTPWEQRTEPSNSPSTAPRALRSVRDTSGDLLGLRDSLSDEPPRVGRRRADDDADPAPRRRRAIESGPRAIESGPRAIESGPRAIESGRRAIESGSRADAPAARTTPWSAGDAAGSVEPEDRGVELERWVEPRRRTGPRPTAESRPTDPWRTAEPGRRRAADDAQVERTGVGRWDRRTKVAADQAEEPAAPVRRWDRPGTDDQRWRRSADTDQRRDIVAEPGHRRRGGADTDQPNESVEMAPARGAASVPVAPRATVYGRRRDPAAEEVETGAGRSARRAEPEDEAGPTEGGTGDRRGRFIEAAGWGRSADTTEWERATADDRLYRSPDPARRDKGDGGRRGRAAADGIRRTRGDGDRGGRRSRADGERRTRPTGDADRRRSATDSDRRRSAGDSDPRSRAAGDVDRRGRAGGDLDRGSRAAGEPDRSGWSSGDGVRRTGFTADPDVRRAESGVGTAGWSPPTSGAAGWQRPSSDDEGWGRSTETGQWDGLADTGQWDRFTDTGQWDRFTDTTEWSRGLLERDGDGGDGDGRPWHDSGETFWSGTRLAGDDPRWVNTPETAPRSPAVAYSSPPRDRPTAPAQTEGRVATPTRTGRTGYETRPTYGSSTSYRSSTGYQARTGYQTQTGYQSQTGYASRSGLDSVSLRRRSTARIEDDLLDADPGSPLTAVLYAAAWYAVPVLVFFVWLLTLDGSAPAGCVTDVTGGGCDSARAKAMASMLGAAPRFGLAMMVSLVTAVLLRWASPTWKTGSVGLAAAVVGGGLSTVLVSVVSGQALG
ncbi:hypothetical protein O7627_36475 [Solwaraspora sp. WMMD1047]|uniref:hypothetical protein n=1 Tax=Solwaraspora sp. WMMD1047 TaxID=3016102 RepID=UPI0024169B09|nr:hypothetical protein [Solwaraspora sp. WMMD1047]MDG4834765.1 hypothetical protein [Solwaraspora sp. WMMD1047]